MIERLILPVSDSDFRGLAQLLVDAVESGAAVSFLAPLSLEYAEDWWRRTISASHSTAVLVARDAEGIVGTVQLHPAWAPNQPHRAEIAKLLAHRRSRRVGIMPPSSCKLQCLNREKQLFSIAYNSLAKTFTGNPGRNQGFCLYSGCIKSVRY